MIFDEAKPIRFGENLIGLYILKKDTAYDTRNYIQRLFY
jgi:hypothetical protein